MADGQRQNYAAGGGGGGTGGGGSGGGGGVRGGAAQGDGYPSYDEELTKITDFLQTFKEYGALDDEKKYMMKLQEVANREDIVVEIDCNDILMHKHTDEELVDNIVRNTRRYVSLFYGAIDGMLESIEPTVDIAERADVYDVLRAAREEHLRQAAEDEDNDLDHDPLKMVPAQLLRRYELRILPPSTVKPAVLRLVKASAIGSLVSIRGMVTRASDVKPLISVVTYTCDVCGFEVYQEINGRQFTPLQLCESDQCRRDKVKGRMFMQTRGSKFVPYQELRIQELPDQVPIGHIPRSMVVHCLGALTRVAAPGENVTIAGIFLPMRYQGFRALKAGHLTETYLEAQHILRHNKGYAEFEITEEMEDRIETAAGDPEVITKLARSIAPEIYGHEDVKKALLLQLVGGVTRNLSDGMRIRGDINICLMGDPGVAKSQLLKHVASVAPRGVFTTGKGSSGVGLTAAVVRDPVTSEMALEGGALVMADRGICCIDEFDKMDESDRTAIHEVMEQQTVSIAKAGITTTLNARAAVLAAANPLYGRYNKRRSLSENINLPNSLLSRFDLMFLVLDKVDMDKDMELARHVTYVHQKSRNPDLGFEPMDQNFIKHYIAAARDVEPYIRPELTSYIVEAYVTMRMQNVDSPSDQTVMTARQLLSILRLSQALARLRFLQEVTSEEVDEAIRLTHMSKASLDDDDEDSGGAGGKRGKGYEDVTSRIYSMIRDYAQQRQLKTLGYPRVEAMVTKKGFKPAQLEECLEEYSALNVLSISADRTRIDFVV